MTKEAESRNTLFEPHISLKDDGALANSRQERLAILLAEGFSQAEALKAEGAGESLTQGKRRYGKRIFTNEVFVARVKTLTDEAEELAKDPIWGEPARMVQQLWRSAVLANDVKTMMDAAKLRMQIAEKRETPAPERGSEARGAGKPASENPQAARLSPEIIRSKLMDYGKREPALDDDTETEGEA